MKAITLQMDGADFDRMSEDAYRWAGMQEQWKVAQGRFSPETPDIVTPNPELKWIYFFPEWLHVVVCRAFIEAEGHPYEISCDQGTGKYAIHTDYESPHVQKRIAEGSF